MQNKDVEDIVFEALNQYLNLEEKLQGQIVDSNLSDISRITKEAFALIVFKILLKSKSKTSKNF